MATINTSEEKLTLYAGMTLKASQEALKQGMLRPECFMLPSPQRRWIPMRSSPQGALERALWGAKELGEDVCDPKTDVVLVEFVFTAHGIGYYHTMKKILTTYYYKDFWKAWRFKDDLLYSNHPYSIRSEKGDILVQVTTNQIA